MESLPDSPLVAEMMVFPVRMRVDCGDIYIRPSQEALMIEAKNESEDLYEKMSQIGLEICNQLQHTPIAGIGHNFIFELDGDEQFDLPCDVVEKAFMEKVPPILKNNLVQPIPASNLNYTLRFQDKDYDLNIYFDRQNDGADRLRFNFHHSISDITTPHFEKFITSFSDSYTIADTLRKSVIKEK